MCVDRHGEAVSYCNFANESKVTTFIEVSFNEVCSTFCSISKLLSII